MRTCHKKQLGERIVRSLLSVSAGITSGAGVGVIFVPLAYQLRGCWAIGGEWVLIISIAIATAYAAWKLDKWFCDESRRASGSAEEALDDGKKIIPPQWSRTRRQGR